LIEPGRPYQFTIDLVATSNLFKRGHRIWLEVSSSNFLRFDRDLNTGGPVAESSEPRIARQNGLS
jgi:predicted acyl esterase